MQMLFDNWLTFGMLFGLLLAFTSWMTLAWLQWSFVEAVLFSLFVLIIASFLWPFVAMSLLLSLVIPKHDFDSFD